MSLKKTTHYCPSAVWISHLVSKLHRRILVFSLAGSLCVAALVSAVGREVPFDRHLCTSESSVGKIMHTELHFSDSSQAMLTKIMSCEYLTAHFSPLFHVIWQCGGLACHVTTSSLPQSCPTCWGKHKAAAQCPMLWHCPGLCSQGPQQGTGEPLPLHPTPCLRQGPQQMISTVHKGKKGEL